MEIKTSVHIAVQTAQTEYKSSLISFRGENTDKKNLHETDVRCSDTGANTAPSLTASELFSLKPMQGELMNLKNAERLDDLKWIRFTILDKIIDELTLVLQPEVGKTESACNRALTDALELSEVTRRDLASAVQLMRVLKESVMQQQVQQDVGSEITTPETVRQDPFVGIQTNETARLLFSLFRSITALIAFEHDSKTKLTELSVTMQKKAAESTIREGKEIFNGALMGFCTAVAITAVGTAFQARGLHKQNQAVEKSLEPANQNQQDKQDLQQLKNQTTETTTEQRVVTGKDGKTYNQEDTPTPADQKQFDSQNQKTVNDTTHQAEVYGQEYDQKTNKYRTQNSIADQLTRTSDNAAQLANASNMTEVKGAEANKMVENADADTARNAAGDKEKQIEKSGEVFKEMRGHMNQMQEATVKTNQALVRG